VRTGDRNGLNTVLSLLVGKDSRSFYAAIVRGFQGKPAKDYYE
jgi:hypothetical protein